MTNIAVLWDIENVTPPDGTHYIPAIIDSISEDGKISYALAFGDWNKETIKKTANELASYSFELIHVPKSRKNSADTSLVAHGIELIFQYPHINRFVLITGDADFRPLLLSLRKYGKETWIICDVKNNASEELLKMADKYFDYRKIIEADDYHDRDEGQGNEGVSALTSKQAFELFKEAISLMLKEKKKPSHGSVKIKMKLLSDSFDEKKLNYKNWNAFVQDAMENTGVQYDENKKDHFILSEVDGIEIPEVFRLLLKVLENSSDWVLFTEVAKKIPYKKYGYSRLKQLALDAEKRGYVMVTNNGLIWSIKRDPSFNA